MSPKGGSSIATPIIAPKLEKKVFLSLLVGAFTLFCLFSVGVWKIASLGLDNIYEGLSTATIIIIGVALHLMGFAVINVFLALKGLRLMGPLKKQTFKVVNLFYPLIILLGRICRIEKRRIEASFVAVSNAIVQNMGLKVKPERLLVVTPHCLQLDTCPHKITQNVENCKRCGRCDVGKMVEMAHEIGFTFYVVTGGTLARKKVMELRPQAVLAVACERDLTSGIQDIYPLPAVGVMNIRPHGPCFNTRIDIEQFRSEVLKILDLSDVTKDNADSNTTAAAKVS